MRKLYISKKGTFIFGVRTHVCVFRERCSTRWKGVRNFLLHRQTTTRIMFGVRKFHKLYSFVIFVKRIFIQIKRGNKEEKRVYLTKAYNPENFNQTTINIKIETETYKKKRHKFVILFWKERVGLIILD